MPPTSATGRRGPDRGFTLIEVLVALALFALSALALVRLQAVSVTSARAVETATLGRITAANLLIEALTEVPAPPYGATGGTLVEAGRRWTWRRNVARVAEDGRLMRIDVAVAAPGKPPVSLNAVRLP